MITENMTILVVDDDVSIRSLMKALLESIGVRHVVAVATYLEAEEAANTVKLHGAFLDLVLQRGSGLDIGRMLTERNVPVVFCSGVTDEFNISQMLEIGWALSKPVRLAGLKRGLAWFGGKE